MGNEPDFTLNQRFYAEVVSTEKPAAFQPIWFLHFVFTLPFQFPLKNGTHFYTGYANHAVFFTFDKFGETKNEPLFAEGNKGMAAAQ